MATELPQRYDYADTLVHGVVLHIKEHPAAGFDSVVEVQVIESFKGGNLRLEVRSRGACKHIFKVGDEGIFFIKGGEIQSGAVEPASNWPIHALRERQSSQILTPY